MLWHHSEGERKKEGCAVNNFAKREEARDFDALRGEEDRDNAEETLIRVHSITRIKTPRLESFQRRLFHLSLFLSLFLLLFFSALYRVRLPLLSFSLSAVFITHRRHGARLHYTHIHSTVAPLWKNLASGLSRRRTESSPFPSSLRLALVAPPLPVSSSSSSPLLLSLSLSPDFGFFSRVVPFPISLRKFVRTIGRRQRQREKERKRERRKERAPSLFRFSLSDRNRNRVVQNQYEATVEFIAVARNCGRAREERFSDLRITSLECRILESPPAQSLPPKSNDNMCVPVLALIFNWRDVSHATKILRKHKFSHIMS